MRIDEHFQGQSHRATPTDLYWTITEHERSEVSLTLSICHNSRVNLKNKTVLIHVLYHTWHAI